MNCEVCKAKVSELRRGRCWGCYNRWVDARPVGVGARCCVCSERRRDHLRSVELLGSWIPMCYTCSGRAMQLDPLPQSLAGIRRVLSRDRRGSDRRFGKRDTRVFQYNRRGPDRREGRSPAEDWMIIDDDMILEIEEILDHGESADGRAEISDPAGDFTSDLTRIRELPLGE